MAADLEDLVFKYFPALYYMAPMENAPLIAAIGILPYNAVHSTLRALGIETKSIADTWVNRRRHTRVVGDKSLHDYVPLYWATHTPMQYIATEKEKKIEPDDLAFFLVESAQLRKIAGVWTTDGNAASTETVCCPGWGALPHLDFKILQTVNCFSKENKRKKAAEVLVPGGIPPAMIKTICVRTNEGKARLEAKLQAVETVLKEKVPALQIPPVLTDCSLYY